MNKVPRLVSLPAFYYSPSKSVTMTSNLEIPQDKKVVKKKNNQFFQNKHIEQKKSFAIFKYLILTTTIIFTFGGLGFGLALRYAQDLQLSQFSVNIERTGEL